MHNQLAQEQRCQIEALASTGAKQIAIAALTVATKAARVKDRGVIDGHWLPPHASS